MADVSSTSTNPFRLIGLPTDATTLEVRRRLDELDMQVRLGIAPSGVDGEVLQRIRPELEDPVKRFRAELRWLLWNRDEVTPHLSTGEELEMWAAQLRGVLETANDDDGPIINHDLAVIATERAVLDPARSEAVVEALVRWQTTNDSGLFRESMRRRALRRNDPRLNDSVVEASLEELHDYALRRPLNGARARDLYTRRRVYAALGSANLATQTVQDAATLLFDIEVSKFAEKTAELSDLLENVPDPTDQKRLRTALDRARSLLLDDVIPRSRELREIAPSLLPTPSVDKVATLAGKLGEMYGYALEEFGSGVTLLRTALLNAERPSVKARLAKDLETLTRAFYLQQFELAEASNDPLALIATMELLSDYSQEPDRTRLREVATILRSRNRAIRSEQIDSHKRALMQTLESDPAQVPIGVQTGSQTNSSKPHSVSGTSVRPPKPIPVQTPSKESRFPRWVVALALLAIIGAGRWYSNDQSWTASKPPPTISSSTVRTIEARLNNEEMLIDENFGYPHQYESSKDAYADIRYDDSSLRMDILQAGMIYYLHPVTLDSNKYTLSASCQHIQGTNGGCALITVPNKRDIAYQLEVYWNNGGMWAMVEEFSQNDDDNLLMIADPKPISMSNTRAHMEIISTSHSITFKVNDTIVFTNTTPPRTPQKVGFGAFMAGSDRYFSPKSDTVTVSFEYFRLRQD